MQRVELNIYHLGGIELVESFSEIRKAWKYDNSIETAAKVNRVLHGKFVDIDGYEYDIARDIMNTLRLEYEDDLRGKACIAMMVVWRRSEIAKTTMKRSWNIHESKVLTKRTKQVIEIEGARKPKVKESFKLQTNKESTLYAKDGSTYSSDQKKYTKCISEHEHLMNRI